MALPPSRTQSRVLRIANGVAWEICLSMSVSNWHAWNDVRSLQAPRDSPAEYTEYETLWSIPPAGGEPKRYGTCVDFAYCTARKLRAELNRVADLSYLANQVQLLCGRLRVNVDGGPEDSPQHMVVGIVIGNAMIVIDVVAHPTAMLIPFGMLFTARNYILQGKLVRGPIYRYSDILSTPGVPMLTLHDGQYWREDYSPITYHDALRTVKFPNARRTLVGKAGEMTDIPDRKLIVFERLLTTPPKVLPTAQARGHYVTTWAKLYIYFETKQLVLSVPSKDWLDDQVYLRNKLHELGLKVTQGNLMSKITLDLTDRAWSLKQVNFFGLVCEAVGLPQEVYKFFIATTQKAMGVGPWSHGRWKGWAPLEDGEEASGRTGNLVTNPELLAALQPPTRRSHR